MRAGLIMALCSCSALNAAEHRKVTLPAMMVDAAVFTAGSCLGMDAQFSPEREDRGTRMLIGYGAALLVWAPLWLVETR